MTPSAALDHLAKARRLANHITSMDGFEIKSAPPGYDNMGALLADAVLQAGVNYHSVVAPRVRRVLDLFPSSVNTTGVLDVVDEVGAEHFLDWKHPEKPRRLCDVARLFFESGIESVDDLGRRFREGMVQDALLRVRGVGTKTVDYLGQLAGVSTVAVDRHLWRFLASANVVQTDYEGAQQVISFAADLLGVRRGSLDASIWTFMSSTASLPYRADCECKRDMSQSLSSI